MILFAYIYIIEKTVQQRSRGKKAAIFTHRPLRQSARLDVKITHQGAVFYVLLSPGSRLGISNAKFHNFKPLQLSFDLIKVAPGSLKMAPGLFKIL